MTRVFFVGFLLLSGCTAPVMMRNSDGVTVQCGPYNSAGLPGLSAGRREAQCIQDYKEQGFVRVPG